MVVLIYLLGIGGEDGWAESGGGQVGYHAGVEGGGLWLHVGALVAGGTHHLLEQVQDLQPLVHPAAPPISAIGLPAQCMRAAIS